MAFVINDRVRETSTTTGSGAFTLAGAVTGYETFATGIGTNDTYYAIHLQDGAEWEVGIGAVSGTTLTRSSVISSSNGDAAVVFSAGTKDVFCTMPASKVAYIDNNDTTINAAGTGLAVAMAIAL
tara:strand:- start:95 stop:469 length:375 start_codon:yes stop_codon:yes gene_type:complete